MSFPADLLDQAEMLAHNEPRKPKQASLRRAVSAAYYALFHLIVDDAANAPSPPAPVALRRVVRRVFQHGQMKATCRDFVAADIAVQKRKGSALPSAIETMLAFPLEADLVIVLTAFVDLQEARHKADYDLSEPWSRPDARSIVSATREAFGCWSRVRKSPNAAVFMTALLIRKDWGR